MTGDESGLQPTLHIRAGQRIEVGQIEFDVPRVEHHASSNASQVVIRIRVLVDAVVLVEKANVLADEGVLACYGGDIDRRLLIPSDYRIQEGRNLGHIPALAAKLIERLKKVGALLLR